MEEVIDRWHTIVQWPREMAEIPEQSDYTATQNCIESAATDSSEAHPVQLTELLPFVGYPRKDMPIGLPFRLQDYLELLDWTGGQFREGKRGSIAVDLTLFLEQLDLLEPT